MKSLKYPLSLDGAGRAATVETTGEYARDRIQVLLSTALGERPEDLTYGSRVSATLFEGQEDLLDTLEEMVGSAVNQFIADVQVETIEVTSDPTDLGTVAVAITFVAADLTEDTLTTEIGG